MVRVQLHKVPKGTNHKKDGGDFGFHVAMIAPSLPNAKWLGLLNGETPQTNITHSEVSSQLGVVGSYLHGKRSVEPCDAMGRMTHWWSMPHNSTC